MSGKQRPWEPKAIAGTRGGDEEKRAASVNVNAQRNAAARRRMSLMELDCGISVEAFDRNMAEQRARVRARWLGEEAA